MPLKQDTDYYMSLSPNVVINVRHQNGRENKKCFKRMEWGSINKSKESCNGDNIFVLCTPFIHNE